MPKKKILILVGDFVEDYEVMVPFQILLTRGARGARRLPRQEGGRHGGHGDSRLRRAPDLQREAGPQLPPQLHLRRRRPSRLRRPGDSWWPGAGVLAAGRARARHRARFADAEQADRGRSATARRF